VPSVSKPKAPKPTRKSPKTAKRWMTADELEQLLAERSGEPVHRVSVFGEPGNWDATLLAKQVGNAERKARFKSLVYDLRTEFDLKTG
jgi:hypothetical protein